MSNVVVLSGNVGQDPTIRQFGDKSLASFSVAVYDNNKEKTSSFFNVEFWGKTAEFCSNYVKKGNKVLITGRLKQESWEKDGKKFTGVKVIGSNIDLLTPKQKEDSNSEGLSVSKHNNDTDEEVDVNSAPF